MNEAIDMAQLLHDTPDLFPWVVLAIVIFVLYRERTTIAELFQSIIQSRKDTTVFHAQQNELVRNNTAALENNTAMLSILQQERYDMVSLLEHHDQMSSERIAHVQTAVDRIDDTVKKNKENIAIVVDRTDN